MPIDSESLLATAIDDHPVAYAERDCMLHALAVGFGSDPLDRRELPYVYEGAALRTVPSMASALLSSAFVSGCGWDYGLVLHGEERLQLYRPLPPAAKLLANQRVTAVHDLGAQRGARIVLEAELRLARDDTVLCNLSRTLIARGDGGFGGERGTPQALHRVPKREADLTCTLPTRSDQALLYRLADDLNPLHADPALARRAGFERPILNGRCTFGIACRAILQTICDYDFTLIAGMEARFTAPVYPGDVLTTEMWQDGNVISFRCRVTARQSVVVDGGRCVLAA